MSEGFIGASLPLSQPGVDVVTKLLNTGAAEVWTVVTVETKGFGFLPDRRPMILFERHIFHKQTGGKFDVHPDISSTKPGGYLGGAAEYDRLARAVALDRTAALSSSSWGLGQVMGFNFKSAGFESVDKLVAAMVESEDAQLAAMASFLVATGLKASLASRDWAAFAKGYNGPDYMKNQYDVHLAASYAKFSGFLPDLLVRQAQVLLTFLKLDPGGIDGARMPPKIATCCAAHEISASASSRWFTKTWTTPARRPGAAAQKSASQRLWAWTPAHRRS